MAGGEHVALRSCATLGRGVALALLVAACGRSAAPSHADALRDISDTLRILQVPAAIASVMTRDSTWRVMVDADSAPRLYLIHQVAALVLPDAPFELQAPLTYFRFTNDRWQQATQERGGTIVPPVVQAALSTDFTDRDRIYFYRIRVVEVAGPAPAAMARLRGDVQGMVRDVAQLRKAGFIGADAEP